MSDRPGVSTFCAPNGLSVTSRTYWNRNLDTDNLSRSGADPFERLDEAIAFASTPEFEWLRRQVGDVSGRRLVDLGGGMGVHGLIWARSGARVVVADAALERMRVMRRLAERAGLGERVACVAARAEAMPFAANCADVIFTKSVLIHTDLPRAAGEIHRVLKRGGRGAFIEPLDRNPIIRLYRRFFAPRVWKSITRYFDAEAMAELRRPFGRLRWKPFYLLSAGSFFWQYGWRSLPRFRRSLRRWRRAEVPVLRRFPALERWSWFASMVVTKTRDGGSATAAAGFRHPSGRHLGCK